jgi:hypothetical protein
MCVVTDTTIIAMIAADIFEFIVGRMPARTLYMISKDRIIRVEIDANEWVKKQLAAVTLWLRYSNKQMFTAPIRLVKELSQRFNCPPGDIRSALSKTPTVLDSFQALFILLQADKHNAQCLICPSLTYYNWPVVKYISDIQNRRHNGDIISRVLISVRDPTLDTRELFNKILPIRLCLPHCHIATYNSFEPIDIDARRDITKVADAFEVQSMLNYSDVPHNREQSEYKWFVSKNTVMFSMLNRAHISGNTYKISDARFVDRHGVELITDMQSPYTFWLETLASDYVLQTVSTGIGYSNGIRIRYTL